MMSEVAFCSHCGNNTPQMSVSRYLSTSPSSPSYSLVSCTTCADVSLYFYPQAWKDLDFSSDGELHLGLQELVWPRNNDLHKSVPDAVRSCYEEAAAIKTRSPNGFAGQIRRALEALCKDRGGRQNTLAKNLKELSDHGEIPPKLGDMTDIIRILGNLGSHAANESVDPAYVDAIDEFFRAVVEYVYVAPYRVNEVQAQLDHARQLRSDTTTLHEAAS